MADRAWFPELIGNERLKSLLSRELAEDRGAHAYVLEGPPGSGKHTAALSIAAAAVCENRNSPSSPLPCGRCASCRKILGGVSVDVLTVSRGDKATIGVEAARAVRESLWVTPNDGDKKFYLIEDAHLMTPQAQNALLLSLEEPPPYVLFLLLCEDASLLLETVRSRAPVIRMERFSPDFIENWLRSECKNADAERIVRAARLSSGALGRALELVRRGDAELERASRADELLRLLLSGRRSDAAVFLASLPKDRQGVRQVIALARFALRDAVAEKRGGELLFYGRSEGVPPERRRVSLRRAVELYDALIRAEDDLASNVSANVALTALIAGM